MRKRIWISLVSILALSGLIIWNSGHHWRSTLTVQVVILVVLAAHHLYFITLPKWLMERGGDPETLRRRLAWIIATPSPLGRNPKILARYLLFRHHGASQRLEEAIAEGRALTLSKVPAGLESDVRRSMADYLERLGRIDEANEQRRQSEACIQGARVDFSERMASGKVLERQNRHAEAYEVYEQGLDLVGPGIGPASTVTTIRAEFMLHLVLTSFNAGRPGDTVRWAERAIDEGATDELLLVAHRMAGVAYGNLGDLERSESHWRRVLELVEPGGKTEPIVKALAQLAGIERKRGRLEAADLSCRKAEAMGGSGFEVHAIFAEIFLCQGRFEEALARYRMAAACPSLPVPAAQRRMMALYDKGMAMVEAHLRRWPEAEAHLLQAEATLRADPKLGLTWEATMTHVLAGQGQADRAIELLDRAEAGLSDFPEDRQTQGVVLGQIGRAALILGDFERAEHLWTLYLKTRPDPVYQPLGHYYLGEALLGQGRLEDANEAFRQSVGFGIDSHHARLARERLAGRSVDPSRPVR